MKIITISREFGSGGRELGKRLAEQLGFAYYDREIVTAIAQQQGADPDFVEKALDSHLWQSVPLHFHHSFTSINNLQSLQTDLLIEQTRVLERIAERGEDYRCGENGQGLSGGEKQRISIARSLLKKSSVLLVDEATAALDAKTAHQVSADLLSLKGMTRIVITHSLDGSLLQQYDGILAMKDGSVLESGTFDELIARKGYFYALYTVAQ